MAVLSSDLRASAQGNSATLPWLIVGLSLAAAVELVVLRTFTRTAIHIPALEQLATPYEWVTAGGRYAYYVAAVLLVLALVALTSALWTAGSPAMRMGAVAAGGFLAAAALARTEIAPTLVADFLTVGALGLVAAATAATLRVGPALSVMLFAAAFIALATHGLLQTASSDTVGGMDARQLLWAGEVVALLFALSAPLAFAAMPGRRATVVGVIGGLVVFAVLLRDAATVKVLLLWNEGLAGAFPALAYAAAATTLFLAIAGLLVSGRRMAALGVALLVIGGFGLHSTYQSGLVVAGFATLALYSGVERSKGTEEEP